MIIEKPWGREEIIETNENYTVKMLTMLKGNSCSLQYHNEKKETIIALTNNLNLTLNGKTYILKKYDSITINPGDVHRMSADETDVIYLECSTSQLNDVIRIEDNYGRT